MSDFRVTIYPKKIFELLLEKPDEILCISTITYAEPPGSIFVIIDLIII